MDNTTNVDTGASALAQAAANAATNAATQAAVNAAIVGVDIKNIQKDISEIKEIIKGLSGEFVTRSEFNVVRNLCFGMVSLIMTGVVGALLSMVLKK